MLRKFIGFLLIVVLMMSVVGCSGENNQVGSNDNEDKEQNNPKLEGKVIVDGSGTVYPLMAHIAEEYMTKEQNDVSVQVGRAGSSAGFTRPVFTYLNAVYAKEKPQVLDYAKYVVSEGGAQRLAGENGFAPLPTSQYAEYLKRLDAIK